MPRLEWSYIENGQWAAIRKNLKRKVAPKTTVSLPFSLDSHTYNGGEAGNCFTAAFRVLFETTHAPHLNAFACHGVVTCTGLANRDDRILHAWVELDVEIAGVCQRLVVDASNIRLATVIFPIEQYYEIGKVNTENIRRYSLMRAMRAAVHTQHNGPWEPSLEQSVDPDLDPYSLLPDDWNWQDD